ncbi:MAG: beta-lactamase family protein [Proteobacteria bacterium]|nr:beta-lactamase family protein [Pseudomonadota bacterium]
MAAKPEDVGLSSAQLKRLEAVKIGDRSLTVEEMVKHLAHVPLKFSPGERWEYGVSVGVLGRLVEVVTGKKLSAAIDERIAKPLGMVDTGFQVPADKVARAAQPGPRPNGQPMTPCFKVDDGAKDEAGGGGHDGGPDARPAGPAAGPGVRSRLRGAHAGR